MKLCLGKDIGGIFVQCRHGLYSFHKGCPLFLRRTRPATSPVPNGLVRTRRSPSCTPLLARTLSGWTTPVTDRPYLAGVSLMEWPPHKTPPAPLLFQLPRRISPKILRSWRSGNATIFIAAKNPAAHCPDIGQRVGCCYFSKWVGITDH